MTKKIGESVSQLPTDPKQEVSSSDMALLKEMFKSAKSTSVKIKDVTHKENNSDSDTDSDSDSDSDTESVVEVVKVEPKSVWSEIKSTFLASLLFVLLNSSVVDNAIKSIGMDGFKLTCIKLFLFAFLFFILRYKFL